MVSCVIRFGMGSLCMLVGCVLFGCFVLLVVLADVWVLAAGWFG